MERCKKCRYKPVRTAGWCRGIQFSTQNSPPSDTRVPATARSRRYILRGRGLREVTYQDRIKGSTSSNPGLSSADQGIAVWGAETCPQTCREKVVVYSQEFPPSYRRSRGMHGTSKRNIARRQLGWSAKSFSPEQCRTECEDLSESVARSLFDSTASKILFGMCYRNEKPHLEARKRSRIHNLFLLSGIVDQGPAK